MRPISSKSNQAISPPMNKAPTANFAGAATIAQASKMPLEVHSLQDMQNRRFLRLSPICVWARDQSHLSFRSYQKSPIG
jgi:hypothetical protein